MSDDLSLSSKKSNFSKSSSNPFTDSASNDGTNERETYQPPEVAKREEANIFRARILVVLIIVLAASAVGASTFLLVKDQEKTNFENQVRETSYVLQPFVFPLKILSSLLLASYDDQFAGYASEILTLSRQKADQLFSALDAFSISIASQAATENALRNTSWPFYSIPDWSAKAKGLARLTGMADPDVVVSPIVQIEEREQFNKFAAKAVPKWYQESVEIEKTNISATEFWQRTIPFLHFFDTEINYYDAENTFEPLPPPATGESIPFFHIYPLRLQKGSPLLPTLFDTVYVPGAATLVNVSRYTGKPAIGFTAVDIATNAATPASQIIQPIHDTANSDAEDRQVVAFTGIRLRWLDYFKNVLTAGEFGVIVVLQSACPTNNIFAASYGNADSSVVTYRIDGENAEYLGDSDLHNPKYDGMEITDVFVDLDIDESELPEGTCIPTMTLHVYPSEDLEESFQTSKAMEYTGVVAASFIFTSLVFLLYDYFVRRRQRKVMERIMRQDKIVSNVFPTAIRDRLYQTQEKQQKGRGSDFNDGLDMLDFEGDSHISGSAPMADLFPSVTVVFADIAGFTAWSSAREPQQVFVLLETIYGAFDKIAYRHSVFKVETVGDCYVSAVGLPEPVDNHVVVACKFARDCKMKMKEVTVKLEVSLGPDTGDLDLRTGIHR
eukprot:scaffold675_cov103-Cylindrotheca_fusiformis.AAC.21